MSRELSFWTYISINLFQFQLYIYKYKERYKATLVFPDGSVVKNLPTMKSMQVWSLSQEDSLEKEMTTQSSILAWEISQTEKPGYKGHQSIWSQELDMT